VSFPRTPNSVPGQGLSPQTALSGVKKTNHEASSLPSGEEILSDNNKLITKKAAGLPHPNKGVSRESVNIRLKSARCTCTFLTLVSNLNIYFVDPTHERAQGNVEYFGEEVKMYKQTGRRGDTGIITDTKVKPRRERADWHQTSSFQNYERLCRGEVRNLVSRFACLSMK